MTTGTLLNLPHGEALSIKIMEEIVFLSTFARLKTPFTSSSGSYASELVKSHKRFNVQQPSSSMQDVMKNKRLELSLIEDLIDFAKENDALARIPFLHAISLLFALVDARIGINSKQDVSPDNRVPQSRI